MPYMPAGFDHISYNIPSVAGNYVVTGGLANCIAIAAYNLTKREMAIAHFNTAFIGQSDVEEADYYWHDERVLKEWHAWIVRCTGANAFCIAIGSGYRDAGKKSSEKKGYAAPDKSRFDLPLKLKSIFHYEPIHMGLWARFGLNENGQPRMDAGPSPMWLPEAQEEWRAHGVDWTSCGREIPYIALATLATRSRTYDLGSHPV